MRLMREGRYAKCEVRSAKGELRTANGDMRNATYIRTANCDMRTANCERERRTSPQRISELSGDPATMRMHWLHDRLFQCANIIKEASSALVILVLLCLISSVIMCGKGSLLMQRTCSFEKKEAMHHRIFCPSQRM